ncbi:MAG: 4-(cytidine 5'-diphospho)-2-C-methyl-D-erythritol kinase [Actinomycetota bacterium]
MAAAERNRRGTPVNRPNDNASGDSAAPADTRVTRRAHAKLTLSLQMTGLRDDGFHLLDAEMVSLELHDRLVIDAAGDGLAATGPFADGVPTDDSNLVARALATHARRAHVTIDKRIPHGGGLGGGSTDAATALAWCGHGTDPAALIEASRVGADIPFCLVGGRARVTGIGEIVAPLPHIDRAITLVIPPLAVSTPAAYRAWDELGGPTGDGVNDLEPAAFVVEPRLREWKRRITELAGVQPTLAGSGATWFLEGEREKALAELVDEGASVLVTSTVDAATATNADRR